MGPLLRFGIFTLALLPFTSCNAFGACLTDAIEAERSAYITVASERSCEHFAHGTRGSLVDDALQRLADRDRTCVDEMSAILARVEQERPLQRLCEEAERRRNRGIGAPGQKSVDDVIASARAAVRKGERVIGAWLDVRNGCGLVVIVEGADGTPDQFSACSDGGTTRAIAVPGEPKLVEMKPPPKGARRAWQTAGLKPENAEILGQRVIEFVDKDGERWDYERYLVRPDGTLDSYQFDYSDYSVETMHPWMHGGPITLDR